MEAGRGSWGLIRASSGHRPGIVAAPRLPWQASKGAGDPSIEDYDLVLNIGQGTQRGPPDARMMHPRCTYDALPLSPLLMLPMQLIVIPYLLPPMVHPASQPASHPCMHAGASANVWAAVHRSTNELYALKAS